MTIINPTLLPPGPWSYDTLSQISQSGAHVPCLYVHGTTRERLHCVCGRDWPCSKNPAPALYDLTDEDIDD